MALLIRKTVDSSCASGVVKVDRHTLYKRRWRAKAEDGVELAVDLDAPVKDGALLDSGNGQVYQIQQIEENVLVIPMPSTPDMGAKIGWYLGNQHLPIEVRKNEIILEQLDTLAASLDRIGIPYTLRRDVFHCKMHSHQH